MSINFPEKIGHLTLASFCRAIGSIVSKGLGRVV
jgi:hypothetical protein